MKKAIIASSVVAIMAAAGGAQANEVGGTYMSSEIVRLGSVSITANGNDFGNVALICTEDTSEDFTVRRVFADVSTGLPIMNSGSVSATCNELTVADIQAAKDSEPSLAFATFSNIMLNAVPTPAPATQWISRA